MAQSMSQNSSSYPDSHSDKIIMSVEDYPFPSISTFKHLIEHWRNTAKKPGSILAAQLELLEQHLVEVPEFLAPFEDHTFIEKHRDILELLISPFFPIQSWNSDIKALGRLFSDRLFYTSSRFEKVIGDKDKFVLREENQDKKNLTLFWRLLYSYKIILGKFYKLPLVIDQPMIYTIPHLRTGLDQYYKLTSAAPFSQINCIGTPPELNKKTFHYLVDNFHNMDLWMKHLPPEKFVFSGFSVHNFVDVTVEESTARLEHILSSNQGSISDESFDDLHQQLKILFRLPDIRLGLASLQGDGHLNLHSQKKSWNSLKIKDDTGIAQDDIQRSIYGKMINGSQNIIIEDLKEWEGKTKVEAKLLDLGVRNITLVPLFYQEKQVGLLEITSPNPGDINTLTSYKLKKIVKFFARAVHENRERFESKVQRVIKDDYTAIHPTVEWRFREAAVQKLELQQEGQAEPAPILFEEVYPLYAAADIRGSSNLRNKSIQDDLVDHLDQASKLLRQIDQTLPLAINSELAFVLDKKIQQIQKGMSPGDESSTIEFILNEVNPLFRHLEQSYPSLKSLLEPFMKQTQSGKELLYNKRKAYESSLKTINEVISGHLTREQEQLQKVFPHYFEKYQTDGVEYNMYIGPALVKDQVYDPIYLRNLRLQQLISCCQIARKLDDLKSRMEVPLLVTQLILVHSSPVNIRFRMEEKQFDVDGAYNVRYEIMKKRIDKAVIEGTKERITQPGHIAVIYTMEKERVEYARYIEYLEALGYLKGAPEYLQLGQLQGVQGLKAIRFKVALEGEKESGKKGVDPDTLEIVKKMEN